ncbi:hypothetical protein NM208_g5365 [Fusarium decemcellulare]|uniref:Uncharacterized protein n=1 Tax=Fusarium decemcellulare TaxID=57161 RepID=A0ACC1SHH8_9HYPO|nr:hypothetical protein NM208_g5365 [Fusarium decemcellulare]
MTGLMNIPDELLQSIAEHIATDAPSTLFQLALVNKRLHNIISPSMLLRRWPIDWSRPQGLSIDGIVLHLFRRPELRTLVKEIRLNHRDTSAIFFATHVEKTEVEEELEQLSAEVKERWPAKVEQSNWPDLALASMPGALAALLLSWATGLTVLDIKFTHFDPTDHGFFLPLILTSQVARKMKTIGQEQEVKVLPLTELRRVHVGWWDTEDAVDGNWAAPFFHLPKMKTFVGQQIKMHSGQVSLHSIADISAYVHSMQFPVGTSPIEEIVLDQADITPEGLGILVRSCRRLKQLSIYENYTVETIELSVNALAQVILHHKTSLETLGIHFEMFDECELYEDFHDGPTTLENCFQDLENLRDLSVFVRPIRNSDGSWRDFSLGPLPPRLEELSTSIKHVFDEDANGQRFLDIGRLPTSLKALHLNRMGSWANFPNYRKRVACYMDGLHMLMRECGPKGKLPNLQYASLPIVDHATVEGIETLKELAEASGVRLGLLYLQVW